MPKATTAQMEARKTQVLTMLVNGADRAEILAYAAKNWQISPRSADTLIKRANAVFEQEAEPVRKAEIGRAIRRLNLIFKKAMSVQDFRVALTAQKQLNDLLALNQPQTLKIIAELLNPQAAAKLAALLKMIEPINEDPAELFDALIAEYAAAMEKAKANDNQTP